MVRTLFPTKTFGPGTENVMIARSIPCPAMNDSWSAIVQSGTGFPPISGWSALYQAGATCAVYILSYVIQNN